MTRSLLRWLGSLLAGTLFGYLTWLLLSLVIQFALGEPGDIPAGALGWGLREGIPHAASGVAFVYTAAKLAPEHPVNPLLAFVAFALILFALLLSGVLAFPVGRLWVGPIAALAGAGVTSTVLRSNAMKRPQAPA